MDFADGLWSFCRLYLAEDGSIVDLSTVKGLRFRRRVVQLFMMTPNVEIGLRMLNIRTFRYVMFSEGSFVMKMCGKEMWKMFRFSLYCDDFVCWVYR